MPPSEQASVHEPAEGTPHATFLAVAHRTQLAHPVPEHSALRIALIVDDTTILLGFHHFVELLRLPYKPLHSLIHYPQILPFHLVVQVTITNKLHNPFRHRHILVQHPLHTRIR